MVPTFLFFKGFFLAPSASQLGGVICGGGFAVFFFTETASWLGDTFDNTGASVSCVASIRKTLACKEGALEGTIFSALLVAQVVVARSVRILADLVRLRRVGLFLTGKLASWFRLILERSTELLRSR